MCHTSKKKNQQNKFNTVRYHFAFVPNMHNNVKRHKQTDEWVKYGSYWTLTHILPHKNNFYSKWGIKQWTMNESLTTVYPLSALLSWFCIYILIEECK